MFRIYKRLAPKHNARKIYFIIDQQIARHFVQYSECLSHPLPFYATQIINPFPNSRISANHEKGYLGFLAILKSL